MPEVNAVAGEEPVAKVDVDRARTLGEKHRDPWHPARRLVERVLWSNR
jgi:hypothetical protein